MNGSLERFTETVDWNYQLGHDPIDRDWEWGYEQWLWSFESDRRTPRLFMMETQTSRTLKTSGNQSQSLSAFY
ncbi:hypothetical protein HPC62_22135 [Thermoleptolyngbya sichuanensis A183]|uniref:Uncharacterized protein n=1 Tax=Thermoleptolyngbya sichuanensis A183 TaxID=2737172 RepID=A0A6M8BQF1_9CYAN|nr:hypothetical protein [Thermoleptolyngbya sichuanensis]QKD84525.1 hypothetical protein HPC62_22135 [Thermoleptolyngbya sichuanensis A183]